MTAAAVYHIPKIKFFEVLTQWHEAFERSDAAISKSMTERNPEPSPSPQLSPGSRFGNYEVIQRLGVGGMGEVYCARDTRLERDVAIKILSPEQCCRPDALVRFEREARSACALNHPNIVTIYEIGEVNEARFIAMELVKGETLRELLASGPIPFRKTVTIAVQIANALAKAHEIGLVHRDLKPENLMITEGWSWRRFWISAWQNFSRSRACARTRTLPSRPLRAMAQSWARLATCRLNKREAANLIFRSDQFSFGSVLYEMVTGYPAFRKNTHAESMAAVLRDEPERAKMIHAPPPLLWIVERCIAKDPKQRYSSTGDLARDLAAVRDRLVEAPAREPQLRINNLPTQRNAFIGREREAAELRRLLSQDHVQLVTLTGPGGIGKTRAQYCRWRQKPPASSLEEFALSPCRQLASGA